MMTQEVTFSIPPYGTASLTLPEVLSPDAFSLLQSAVSGALDSPPRPAGAPAATDPGSIEFDSWLVHLK